MSLLHLLCMPMQYALEGVTRITPGGQLTISTLTHGAPSRRIIHTRRTFSAADVPARNGLVRTASPSVIETPEPLAKLRAQPRSLSDGPSSTASRPLLIGVLIGVFGLLFFQGFLYIIYKTHRRNQEFKVRSQGRTSRPSNPLNFRHVEQYHVGQFPNSTPANKNTPFLLRTAHRLPNGSWSFADVHREYNEPPVPLQSPPALPAVAGPIGINVDDAINNNTAISPNSSPSDSHPTNPRRDTVFPLGSSTPISPTTPQWSTADKCGTMSSGSSGAPPAANVNSGISTTNITTGTSTAYITSIPPPSSYFHPTDVDRDCGSSTRTGPPPYPYPSAPIPTPSIPPISYGKYQCQGPL